jgi:CheY-like chemotaxis protein
VIAELLDTSASERTRHLDKMAAVSQLAGGLSRDVGLLVQEAEGAVRQVLAAGDSPSLQYRRLEEAAAALQRVGLITRQLGVLAEKPAPAPAPRSLAFAVKPLLPLVQRLAGPEVTVTTPPFDTSAWVCLQPGHLEQMLFHLVVNARDAMAQGGSLHLSVTKRTLEEPIAHRFGEIAAGTWAVLEVRDTGVGMAEDTLDRLFEPFFTTKPKGQGSGLGLATIYGMIRQMEGQVLVTSTLGHGTTISAWLPAQPPENMHANGLPEGTAILVVDEDDWVRTVTGRMLRKAGYGVLEAANLSDAWGILGGIAGSCVHAIIADGSLPGSPGLKLARQMAEERPGVRVIMTTGQPGQPGSDGILRKPFTGEQLVRALRGT